MPKAPRERVAVTHPHGRPTVLVSPSRAEALLKRGYTPGEAPRRTRAADEPALNRRDLNARAKELGIPATGKNEELAAATAAAEAAAGNGDDGDDT